MKQLLLFGYTFLLCFATLSQSVSESRETTRTSSSDGASSESSITRSDNSYRFDARFADEKYEEVQKLLMDKLGSSFLTKSRDAFEWERKLNGMSYFRCRLSGNTLRLTLDRTSSSRDFYYLINDLGEDLKGIIQQHVPYNVIPPTPPIPPNPNSNDPQLYDDELRRAELELERARQNLERLKKKKEN